MTEEGDRIIGTPEAADILGWNIRKVQRKANTEEIPIVGRTTGRHGEYLFRASEIEQIRGQEEE